jgi:hypothetical protein
VVGPTVEDWAVSMAVVATVPSQVV